MNLNKLHENFKTYQKLLDNVKEDYKKILSKEDKKIEDLTRLADFNFTEGEKETIARLHYYSIELQKLQKIALIADYLGNEFDGIDEMRQTENYNLAMESLKSPLIVLDSDEPKINNKEGWEGFKLQQIELFKNQFNYINQKLNESE